MRCDRYLLNDVIRGALIHCFLLIVAVACISPLLWMLRCSLMSDQSIFTDHAPIPQQISFASYATAWTEGNFATFFLNSVFYTSSVVLGIVIISSLAAFAFSRLRFPGRDILFYVFVAAMMVPLPGSFVSLFVLMNKFHLVDTRIGYILCMINVGLSLSILLLKPFFDRIPQDLEDAARIDGCSRLQIWWHVALPMARPALALIVIYNSLNVWSEFILASLLLNERSKMPLQVGLMVFQGAHQVDYPVLMAGLTMTALPILAVYLLMQKYIVKGLSSGVVSG